MIVFVISIVFGAFFAFAGLGAISMGEPSSAVAFFAVAMGLITLGRWRKQAAKANKLRKLEEKQKAAEEAEHLMQQLNEINEGRLPVLAAPPVLLKPGEVAHVAMRAMRSITKNKAVGRTGGGSGVSVRVAKGVSVRTGAGSSRTIYSDVTDKFVGQLVLTNENLIFVHSTQGFTCKISSINAISTAGESDVVLQVGAKNYSLTPISLDLFLAAIQAIRNQMAR